MQGNSRDEKNGNSLKIEMRRCLRCQISHKHTYTSTYNERFTKHVPIQWQEGQSSSLQSLELVDQYSSGGVGVHYNVEESIAPGHLHGRAEDLVRQSDVVDQGTVIACTERVKKDKGKR